MTKDKLEEFIKENRAEFDLFIPEKKVWGKLKSDNKLRPIKSRKIIRALYRVAAAILIFTASYAFHEFMDIRENNIANTRDNDIYKLIPELQETEFYYNNLVNLKMDELQPFLTKFPGLEAEVHLDFSELDSIYSSLKDDLKDNIANDQVIEAMIQNYRLKIKILEDMLTDISPDKIQDENEKYNI
ncbi:MAG: hypothetical protein KAS71_01900 [Bacteroidales bacterium]|nr:hypothetical protein [Bacteroidales bacterium]